MYNIDSRHNRSRLSGLGVGPWSTIAAAREKEKGISNGLNGTIQERVPALGEKQITALI